MSENRIRDSGERNPESRGHLNWLIAIVVIAVVIGVGGAVFLMSLEFGSQPSPPTAGLVASGSWSNKVFTITDMEGELRWSDAKIMISNASDFTDWSPITESLWLGPGLTQDLGEKQFGSANLHCSVTDLEGNGRLDAGDFFTLRWLSGDVSTDGLSVAILNEQIGMRLCGVWF